jgi:hypothetical protein
MAGRRTNIALAVLLAVALVTGVVSFAIGTGWARPVLVLHGLAAVAIVLLAPWKSVIAGRGLRRRRRESVLSTLLAVLVVAALVSGVAHTVFDVGSVGPLAIMQVHVGAAVGALVLGMVHVRRRPQRVRVSDLSRRNFLRTAALAIGAVFGYFAVEAAARATGAAGATRRFTGSHEHGSFDPASMPVTSWLNDTAPAVVPTVAVRTAAGVTNLSIQQLTAFDDHLTATLDCTSGWHATQEWSGARLERLVDAPGSSVRVISATGYQRRFAMGDVGVLLLATHVGGAPLSVGHGAPVRLVAPGRRGFWWVKWVCEIVVDERPAWWQPPFPLS